MYQHQHVARVYPTGSVSVTLGGTSTKSLAARNCSQLFAAVLEVGEDARQAALRPAYSCDGSVRATAIQATTRSSRPDFDLASSTLACSRIHGLVLPMPYGQEVYRPPLVVPLSGGGWFVPMICATMPVGISAPLGEACKRPSKPVYGYVIEPGRLQCSIVWNAGLDEMPARWRCC